MLFVCVHNAGRSQMAAALLNAEAKGRIRVRSAGSMPAAELDPAVVAAMSEMGLDLTKDYPKPLTDDVVRASDVIIIMGCGDSCPIYPGKRHEDWELTDPAGPSKRSVPSATRSTTGSGDWFRPSFRRVAEESPGSKALFPARGGSHN